MSLYHTLLGVLSWHPMTGYELKKHLDHSVQFFWHAELSQIYPTHKELEEKGHVSVEVIPQNGKPDKKIYALTPAGRDELIAWLSEPLDQIPPNKNVVLLKLFFAGLLDKAIILAQLRLQLEAYRARWKRVQTEGETSLQEGLQIAGAGQESLMWKLVHQYGVMNQQMVIQWLEMAIAAVEAEGQ